jgi:hypothetical protein
MGGVRPGHAVADRKAAHSMADLIDFPNEVISPSRTAAGGA